MQLYHDRSLTASALDNAYIHAIWSRFGSSIDPLSQRLHLVVLGADLVETGIGKSSLRTQKGYSDNVGESKDLYDQSLILDLGMDLHQSGLQERSSNP